MSKFEKQDLIKFVSEPLDRQYQRIEAKMFEAFTETHGDIVLCFSGGKDSALLLDMWCEVVSKMNPNITVKVAFANTTNETAAMKRYIPYFIKRCEEKYGVHIDFTEVKPKDGNNIITVIRNEGIPFISKATSAIIRKVTADMERNNIKYEDVKDMNDPTLHCRDALREMGLSDTTVLSLTGWSCERQDFGIAFRLPKQWMPLLDIKNQTGLNIRFTEKCCQILKKDPLHRLNYNNVMTGEQALESKQREESWLKTGCNYRIDSKSYKSKPLAAVSMDTVLYVIKEREVPICEDYGEIVCCNENKRCYKCTGAQRTGCALCGFGIKYDPERFIRLQETEPAKVRAAFKPISEGGLGYKEACEYSNEYCKTKIKIPKV